MSSIQPFAGVAGAIKLLSNNSAIEYKLIS